MNANTLAKHYDRLSPEERFRLILAAAARRDDAEQNRLRQSAPRITLSCSDHTPWSQAFDQLAMLIYMELVEEAARHHDAFERYWDVVEVDGEEHDADTDGREEGEEGDTEEEILDPASFASESGDEEESPSLRERMLRLYYAQGFMLKIKIAGWKLFCERLTVPPFALWKLLPGFDRFQRNLDLLESNQHGPPPAFEPEGMVRWLNGIRREDQHEVTLESLLSSGRFADELESAFRRIVGWLGG